MPLARTYTALQCGLYFVPSHDQLIFKVITLRKERTDTEEHLIVSAAAAAKSLQSCLTLCDPIDSSPPGSPIPGILQARTLERVALSFSSTRKWKAKVKSQSEVAQSCPTLSDPMDRSLLGSSVHGIFQARVLEWVTTAFSLIVSAAD